MKKILFTAVLAIFTVTGAFAETVRLGTEGAYEPWNFVNDAGKLDGFEIELGNELCKRASLRCEWVKNDWDSIIPNLKSGNYDAIIAGMSNIRLSMRNIFREKIHRLLPHVSELWVHPKPDQNFKIRSKRRIFEPMRQIPRIYVFHLHPVPYRSTPPRHHVRNFDIPVAAIYRRTVFAFNISFLWMLLYYQNSILQQGSCCCRSP